MRGTKNKKIYEEVANNNGVSPQMVKDMYESIFRFMRERVSEVDGLSTKTEEEFKNLRLSFNIPLLGKFYITYNSLQQILTSNKHKYEYFKNKKDKTTIQ